MVNHPNRKQVRLSLSYAELKALGDLIEFATRQGYHPFTDYARAQGPSAATTVAEKVQATQAAIAYGPLFRKSVDELRAMKSQGEYEARTAGATSIDLYAVQAALSAKGDRS